MLNVMLGFAAPLEWSRIGVFTWVRSSLPRKYFMWLAVTNALAYSGAESITAFKKFYDSGPGWVFTKP